LAITLPEPQLATIPEQFAHGGISVQQILSIVRAYWKQSLAITLCTATVAATAIKFLPKTYTATATLIVNSDTKDPLAGRDFPVEMLASYVATQTELMQSPVVLMPVVDRLKLTQNRDYTSGFAGSADALREYVESPTSTSNRTVGGSMTRPASGRSAIPRSWPNCAQRPPRPRTRSPPFAD
jgi:hypothetical protein